MIKHLSQFAKNRLIQSSLLASLLVISLPTMAEKGFYVAGKTGVHFPDPQSYILPGATPILKLHSKPGFNAAAAVGYQTRYANVEVEFNYLESDHKEFRLARLPVSTRVSGDTLVSVAMINAFLNLPNKTTITPYIGGGLGYADIALTMNNNLAGIKNFIKGREDVPAYQAIAGVRWNAAKHLNFTLSYRFLITQSARFTVNDPTGTLQSTHKENYSTSAINIGFTYLFM